ncbi:FtsH protease activity modulator HflK [Lacrimispora sp.]|uniref:FtsH protease activity modulator HflK n=1 Tax=Lacrimispora sp. TaxID=2719234 RepID=UPI003460A0C1
MGRKEKTIFITIIANVVLILLRFFLAGISGSIGLEANAWHSFTDVFVSSIVFIGLMVARLGARKWNKAVNKIESILAVFVSVFIFYMGFEILADALDGAKAELRYVPFVAAGAFVGVIINYFMARYKIYVGEQTGSQSLIADGYHSKMDMYCSIAVLVGIIGSLFGMNSLDKMAAIVAMVLLMISGYEILVSNLKLLLHPEEEQNHEGHSHGIPHGSKKMYAWISGALAAAFALSGVYIVDMDEVGIVRRFGKVVSEEVTPGLHYRIPAPVDQVTLVKKDMIQKLETGSLELLSGDTNLVNVNMTVHYKVMDPISYALNVTELESLVKAGATTGIREIVGRSKVDWLLTEGKSAVETEAEELLQKVMDTNGTGIVIVGTQLIDVSPPEAVKASFQDLASARQDKAVYMNEAAAYKNTIIPQANADAYKQVAEAQGYKEQKIKNAEGDAASFTEKQAAYSASRGVNEFRMYMETMDKILPNVQKILLGGNVRIDNAELWISNLNRKTSGGED